MRRFKLSICWKAMKKAAVDFIDDHGFKFAASLSYSMIFAMAPLLIVVISLAGIFWGQQAVEGHIYQQIKDLVGVSPAIQIQDIIRNIQQSRHTLTGAIIGGVILVIGASGVFTEIQGSINHMWGIQSKHKKGWLKFLINRLLSFSLVVGFGFISMVSLVVNSLMDVLSDDLKKFFTHFTVDFFYGVNFLLAMAAIVLLFMVIFRILPDALINWADAFVGALFTGILFMLGKLLISVYLGHSNITHLYGAAASIIVILTWVYYSSIILYYGAAFTRSYAILSGGGIRPSQTAVFILKQESREFP